MAGRLRGDRSAWRAGGLLFWSGRRVGRWAQPPVPMRTRWATGWAAFDGGPPAGWLQTEVVCHDMQKKVIPFGPRKSAGSPPVTEGHSQITIRLGGKSYILNIPCPAVALPLKPVLAASKGRLEQLQVQTRFLRLGQPVGLGDRIDGWRVCWVGGWDKSRVLFVVMVERVGRAART
jgi:hypothetical protein